MCVMIVGNKQVKEIDYHETLSPTKDGYHKNLL